MPFVNPHTREITCKIVYYGPSMSGKTTNLQWIHRKLRPETRGELVSMQTEGDRTLFFDYLPVQLGCVSGFQSRLGLYTVPGERHYRSTRRIVLNGADAIVFVADTEDARFSDNVSAFADLHQQLASYGRDPREVPIILQYNKLDLPAQLRTPTDMLDRMLNARGLSIVPASAIDGEGVFQTLRLAVNAAFQSIEARNLPEMAVA